MFDDRDYANTFGPPRIVLGGRTFVGVVVSADEWFAIAPKIEAAQADESPDAVLFRALVRPMTDLCFPPPPWWRFWTRSVAARLSRLPWGAQMEALTSFTVAQVNAQRGRAPGRTEAMDGMPSST